jgi:hypothetical protein
MTVVAKQPRLRTKRTAAAPLGRAKAVEENASRRRGLKPHYVLVQEFIAGNAFDTRVCRRKQRIVCQKYRHLREALTFPSRTILTKRY